MPGTDDAVRYGAGLSELERQRPELLPWLRPLGVALRALDAEPWISLSPLVDGEREEGAPALQGALVPMGTDAMRAHVRAVLGAALGPEGRVRREDVDAAALLEAAVAQDAARLAGIAADAALPPERLAAAAQLAALALLHACARRIAPEPLRGWTHRYCHVCGALPLLAEVLGLERARQLRCGRCGSGWHSQVLLCPFCGERDHARLGSLVPDGPGGQVCHVETCATCRGYWKTRTVLRALAPDVLLLEDARSIELDIAAVERGFRRPAGGGYAVRIRIAPAAAVS